MRKALPLLVGIAFISATCGETRETAVRPRLELALVKAPQDLGQRAYEHVARLVDFGPRFTGSPGWQQGLDYIAHVLRENTGHEPVRDRWTDPTVGITFENIHVTFPGKSPHRIVIACHHDTKKCEGHDADEHNYYFVGANDSGSGVGLLLELAAELAKRENEATIQLVFFDGEESLDYRWDDSRALFGSKRFVAEERARLLLPDQNDKTRALILLDMVGRREMLIDEELNSNEELRHIFWSAACATGHQDLFFVERMAIKDDHLPFLQAGIPAIDLIDLKGNPQWHTVEDTLAHISERSLHVVGEVVLTALPAVEARYFGKRGNLDLPENR